MTQHQAVDLVRAPRRVAGLRRPHWLKNVRISIALGSAFTALVLVSGSQWGYGSVAAACLAPIGVLLVGLALAGRLWTLLYQAGYKNRTLLTSGPYSVTRNPLYLCNWIGGLGALLTTATLTLPLVYTAGYALQYAFVIRREEAKLRRIHGEAFERYRSRTPVFLPAWSLLREPAEYAVRTRLYRAKMLDAFVPIVALAALQVNASLHVLGILPTLIHLY